MTTKFFCIGVWTNYSRPGQIFSMEGHTKIYFCHRRPESYYRIIHHVYDCADRYNYCKSRPDILHILPCREITHIHVLLLVGIFIIKHATNYTEGKVHKVHSAQRTKLSLAGMHKNTRKRELNITFKLLNQRE